jgi:transcriptional regulator with XRE-family HTH domain
MGSMDREIIYTVPLKEILEQRGISGELFAVAAGVTMASYRAYCRGVRQPSPETVITVERLLKIERYELRPDLWPPPKGQRTKRTACRKAA